MSIFSFVNVDFSILFSFISLDGDLYFVDLFVHWGFDANDLINNI